MKTAFLLLIALLSLTACIGSAYLWEQSARHRIDLGRTAYDRPRGVIVAWDLVTTPGCINVIRIALPPAIHADGSTSWDNTPPQYDARSDIPERSWDAEIPGSGGRRFYHFAYFDEIAPTPVDPLSSQAPPIKQVQTMRTTLVCVPAWSMVALFAVPPVVLARRLRRLARRRARLRNGLCTNCGYDLRASPGVCPECGTPPGPQYVPAASSGPGAR